MSTLLFCLLIIAAPRLGGTTPGTLDTSFGGDGIVTTDFGLVEGEIVFTMLIQSDGKVIVLGQSDVDPTGSYDYSFALARYNTDGSLDTTFGGGDGLVITDSGYGGSDWGSGSVLQEVFDEEGNLTSRKIVMAGFTPTGGAQGYNFIVQRYNDDGSLDTTFGGGDGIASTDLGSTDDGGYSVVVQDDGKYVIAGERRPSNTVADGSHDLCVIRLTSSGDLDTSFSDDGWATFKLAGDGAERARFVALQSDGKIVAAGYNQIDSADDDWDYLIVRFNTNGTLDTSFGTSGYINGDLSGSNFLDYVDAVAVDSQDRVIVSGTAEVDRGLSIFTGFIRRYTPDGDLDPTFDGDGIVEENLSAVTYLVELDVQDNDKVVVGGYAWDATLTTDFTIIRYNEDGSRDTTFGGDGLVTANIDFHDWAYAVAIQSDDSMYVAGLTMDEFYNDSDFAVVKFSGNVADVEISGSSSDSGPSLGDDLTYTFTVTNNGPDESGITTFETTPPAGLTILDVSTDQGDCTVGDVISCEIGSLSDGAVVTVDVSAQVVASGETISMDTTVDPGQVRDTDTTNNSVSSIVVVPPTSFGSGGCSLVR